MASIDFADLARKLWPYLSGYVGQLSNGSSVITAAASSTSTSASAPGYASFLTLAADADLSAERVFTLATNSGLSGTDAGAGAAYTLTLGTPSTLTVSTTNALSGTTHSHAITSSSSPGAAASLLASNASGVLTLVQLTATTRLRSPILDTASGDLALSPASGITTASQLTATTRVRTPIVDTASGDLALSPATNNTTASRITLSDRLRSPILDTASGDLALSPATGTTTATRITLSDRLRTPLIDTASGDLTLSPAQDVIVNSGGSGVRLMASNAIFSDGYQSQTTGMAITHAGGADFRYLFTDELHAKSFIADLEQALAGGQVISKSVAVLHVAFTMPAPGGEGYFYVRDLPSAAGMRVFEDRDMIRFRSFTRDAGSLDISDAWGEVYYSPLFGFNLYPGTQRYKFVRRTGVTIDDTTNDPILDTTGDPILANNVTTPEGGMAGGTPIYADSIVLDYGKNQSGIHEINAIDGIYGLNSPYAQTVSWVLHPKNATVRTRIGNLRGVFGVADEYGFYAGSGTANADQYVRVSTNGVRLNNVPLALYSNNSQRVNIDSNGTDIWFSNDGGVTKQFDWNGSSLTLRNSTLVLAGTGTLTLSSTGIFGVDSTSLPSFSIVNTAGSVNGEPLNAGDVMLGSNDTNKANLYYDRNNGYLRFRYGKITTALINTSGAFVSGTSLPYMQYDSNGLTAVMGGSVPGTVTTANAITWHQNADRTGTRYGYLGVVNLSGTTFMTLNSNTVLRLETPGDTINLGQLSTLAITSGSGRSITLDVAASAPTWAILLQKATQVNANFNVGGATTLSSTLAVTGATTLSSTLGVTGATTLSSTLTVSSFATFNAYLTANNGAAVYNGISVVSGSNEWKITNNSTNLWFDYNSSNKVQLGSSGTMSAFQWLSTSDARLKDVQGDYSAGLFEILQLQPVRYRWKESGEHRVGLLAQAVREVLPDVVCEVEGTDAGDGTPLLALSADDLVYVLINAVKELHGRVKELEATCQ